MRVAMFPHLDDIQPNPTAGISQVVKHYFARLPKYDIELAAKGDLNVDLVAIHAAAATEFPNGVPLVSHCHGLYFTADAKMDVWTHDANRAVIDIVRHAHGVTVPSRWVAEIFRRDMHLAPEIVPHGVAWEEWQGGSDQGYVLWNKNRASDACDPVPLNELARRASQIRFLTTYAAPAPSPNVKITGTVAFDKMKEMVKGCSVYLATTKETFGVGTLEAMAAGKPVLGFDYGGTADLIKHGYSGYLARPGDYDDLAQGLEYCLKHAHKLGWNAMRVAQDYDWDKPASQVAECYQRAIALAKVPLEVTVVIPMYNKAATVLRAIRSAANQTYPPRQIIVVNNNSTDDFAGQVEIAAREVTALGTAFALVNCPEQGVAHARNFGIKMAQTELICCLDADDEIRPTFIERCRLPFAQDASIGIAYTGLEAITPEGYSTVSAWPGVYDLNRTLHGQNQVPTCCMFRRGAWQRAGGYRQRYAPNGAGSEDADLWLRIALLGWNALRATSEPLFRYYLGGTVSGSSDYHEVDWRGDKGWITLGQLPFATPSTPANGRSHLVRQYDEPDISVIIPVGPGHIDTLIDAIDSVEGQTFRRWELIVVDDGATVEGEQYAKWVNLLHSFPYIRRVKSLRGPRGAGHARNRGAEIAKAPLLLFLDADDWLTPTALAEMIEAHNDNPDAIIYADYIGHAYIDNKSELERLEQAKRLISYNDKSKEAAIHYYAFRYDANRAQQQPISGQEPYVWNVVSSLVPRSFHREINGFDEDMESWEDWDYWVRLAKAGKCFCHIPRPLLEYRFYTGKRRVLANPYESGESGRQLSVRLLEYMQRKYEEIENMPGCTSCGGRRAAPQSVSTTMARQDGGIMSTARSNDLVMVELVDGNIGEHLITFQGQSYGYRKSGDRFEMLVAHANVDRRVRAISPNEAPGAVRVATPLPPLPPPPNVAEVQQNRNGMDIVGVNDKVPDPNLATDQERFGKAYDFDLTQLWGVDHERAGILSDIGVRSPDGVIALGWQKISTLFSLPEITSKRIISEAVKTRDSLPSK